MAVVNKNNIIDVVGADGAHYVKIYDMNENVIWEAGGGSDWQLDESDYIIGEDGKYYQKLIDWNKAVDYNPVPDLNNEWFEDTITPEEERVSNYTYFMSEKPSVIGVGNFRQFKVQWKGLTSITFKVRLFSSWSSYNYVVVNGLDKPAFTSTPTYSTSGLQFVARGDNFNGEFTVECDEGEHHLWFCHTVPDLLGRYGNNPASVAIRNDLVFYPDGSIKKGSELRYEYIPSGDYLEVREGIISEKIYKHYFTPDNTKDLKTEEYILGDEFEATKITRDYLRFDAVESDVVIGVDDIDNWTDLEYSKGFNETWFKMTADGVLVPQGTSLYLRSENGRVYKDYPHTAPKFTTSDRVECHGNLLSIQSKDNFENQTVYKGNICRELFKDSKITTTPVFYNKGLEISCFRQMFENCKELIVAPELPSTSVYWDSYNGMFKGCTNLTTPPSVLPSKGLSTSSYKEMFYGCSNLRTVPEILAENAPQQSFQSMFYNCGKITTTPSKLPSNDLGESCFEAMFYGCGSLTSVPADLLPATQLANSCYKQMFRGCAFTTAPNLPATEITNNCYQQMFWYCGKLVNAPELPAMVMKPYCYHEMFGSCGSLVNPPSLPATTLAEHCYRSLFMDCQGIKVAPNLPATELVPNCYGQMFESDYNLEVAPDLPALVVPTPNQNDGASFSGMFRGCRKLNKIKCNVRYDANGNELTSHISVGWLDRVSSTGTFYKNPDWSGPTERNGNIIPDGWEILDWEDAPKPEPEPITRDYLRFDAVESDVVIGFSNDGNKVQNIQYSNGDGIWFSLSNQGVNVPQGTSIYVRANGIDQGSSTKHFTTSAPVECHGNIMSLLGGDFENNFTVGNYQLSYIFSNTKITTVPELPATTLGEGAYEYLFSGCKNLTIVPKDLLKANNIPYLAYRHLFADCTNLIQAPDLTASNYNYYSCDSVFQRCSNLKVSPRIYNATTGNNAFQYAFEDCVKLEKIYCYLPSISFTNFSNRVPSTGVFYKNPTLTNPSRGTNAIPAGWEVRDWTTYPEIPDD